MSLLRPFFQKRSQTSSTPPQPPFVAPPASRLATTAPQRRPPRLNDHDGLTSRAGTLPDSANTCARERTQRGFSRSRSVRPARAVRDRGHKRRRTFVGPFRASSEAPRDIANAVRSALEDRASALTTSTTPSVRTRSNKLRPRARASICTQSTVVSFPGFLSQPNSPLFLCSCEPFTGCH